MVADRVVLRSLIEAGRPFRADQKPNRAAFANASIFDSTGSYFAGIGPNGELYDESTDTGLRNPAGSDYILPGTPRDSWGIASEFGSAYADYQENGTSGIIGTVTTATDNTATLLTTTDFGLNVTHFYSFINPNILSVQETVTNTSASSQTIVFRRDVDFDVDPTAFAENTYGPIGSNPNVLAASYYGFESANPQNPFDFDCTNGCNATGDLGAGIDFNVGLLGAGESKTFAFYYGINQPGQTLDGLFTEASSEGLTYLIGVQSTENGIYPALGSGSAILGVSSLGTVAGAVPEPAS